MTITSIKQQQKNPDRVSIYVDGKYGFSLNLAELLNLQIKTGQNIEGKDLRKYKKLSEEGKNKMSALNWLMIRPRSEKEFYQYLARKKTDSELAINWSEEFKSRQYLNDERFAIWWAESRRQNKSYSTKKIKLELMQKGVNKEHIEQAIGKLEKDETHALLQVVAKKSKLAKYKTDKEKFTRYLLGQGFKYSDIKEALNFPADYKDT